MGKTVKIVLSFLMAVVVAGGYAYYVQASQESDVRIVVAAKDISAGETIEDHHLNQVAVMGEAVQALDPAELLGKSAKKDIKAGEFIIPELVTEITDENTRLYTVDATYTTANGPVIEPGMNVEVWVQATEERPAALVTESTVYSIIGKEEPIELGSDVGVTLQVHQKEIEALETARAQAPLFLVVKGEDVH
ncbi:SAF domain-containing protein [Novibacillus thermophilus]|uniref:SAF domain-containing protein n=1 Tax=Novibacillus thermophilus TaxID=1471761 RepID=A0A1U9K6E7_9BACL|nr:SAF domain-containing protein [Novibacillus thermophilus]AQS55639.1 hypothetical protein B0W44_07435 [Novibacillus thermophilus]